MYNKFQLGLKYLHYYLTAANGKGHGIHSPFIFEFITKVLKDKTKYPAYKQVEALRQQLLKNETLLSIDDPGAGSSISKTNQRTIASIAKNAAKSKKFGQLLYRMVKYYQPETILELGTSLGITTSYLATANPKARVITIEGAKAVATIAIENFNTLNLQNVKMVEGNFDDTLSSVIGQFRGTVEESTVNFAFIDGNHRREPTERYFEQILSKTNYDSILVFDDIHWSGEMEQAWETIKSNEAVRYTIDLFFIGIVFFRQEFKEKQHFVIRF
jgi:predicted O-methyltransferase YrrM